MLCVYLTLVESRHPQSIHALQMKTWTPEQWEAKGKPEKFE
jgi:acid stress-induced BolA-like protein IbaG/YrbA